METLVRRAMLLPLVAFSVAACSDDGPSGPQVPAGSGGISGQLTASAAAIGAALGLADGDDDFFIGSATLANVTVEITDAAGVAVFSTDTDGAGRFTSDLSPGTYTIVVTLDDGSELSFVLEVAEGEMLFVRGKVDLNPSGKLKINLKIFHDQDGDGEADDNFTIRITGREAGQPSSGTTDAETLGAADKVVVCHAPPGNPDNEHTIVVGPSAEQAQRVTWSMVSPMATWSMATVMAMETVAPRKYSYATYHRGTPTTPGRSTSRSTRWKRISRTATSKASARSTVTAMGVAPKPGTLRTHAGTVYTASSS